jgi:transposase
LRTVPSYAVVGIPPSGGHLTQAPAWKGVHDGTATPAVSPEFKRDAIALHKSSGRSIAMVAKELGIGESNLGGWLTKDREQRAIADPVGFAAEVAESDEVRRLRRRVAELEVEREILKRFMVFWVKESNA